MIDALPVLNRTDATFKTDVETFFGTDLPAFSVQAEAARVQINSNTTTAQAQADLATAQVPLAQAQTLIATQQSQAAASSALSAGAIAWVSGTTYAIGNLRYSPLNSQVYRRLTAGAGTTDPSLDVTNWIIVNGITSENINLPSNNLPVMRPSLNLDFAGNQAVDPRITFARTSTATRTNARGLIEAVASGVPRIDFDAVSGACRGLLIEEQRTNLLTYSEQFDNAAWTKTRATITANATTAPDGTLTADKLIEDTTASNSHDVRQYPTVSGAHTVSVFAKADTRSSIFVDMYDATNGTRQAVFNLSSGVVTYVTPTVATAQIQAVGNGWYRCSISVSAAATGGDLKVGIYNSSALYTGDGTSGLFIWGAQLEAGAFPTTYQPSTETHTGRASTATFYGSNGLIQTAASGVARMNYNPANLTVAPKLLLEAAGTNLLTYSEAFDNAAWAKGGSTVTANATTAPDGTLTTDKLMPNNGVAGNAYTGVVLTAATHTVSIYAKAGEFSWMMFGSSVAGNVGVWFNLSTGSVGAQNSGYTGTITNVGGGFYRCSVTFTGTAATWNTTVFPTNADGALSLGNGTSGIFIWGAQLEASPYATSYIPTVASQVTRVADSSTSAQTTRVADVATMTGANFSSWYRADEGSFAVDAVGMTGSAMILTVSKGLGTYGGRIQYNSYAPTLNVINDSGSVDVAIASGTVVSNGVQFKTAGAYKVNDVAISTNGSAISADSSCTLPTAMADLRIGNSSVGTNQGSVIKSITYYPKRLTNAELQALSTQ